MARCLAWMEQQSTDTVGPRWTATLVCHMHRSSLEICILFAILPPERWTRRILAWNMRGPRKRGRPAYTWETALQIYSIWKGFDSWIVEAAARERWMLMKRDFVVFTLHNR